MVSQQFNNQIFNILVASCQSLAFLGLEDDVFNLLHLGEGFTPLNQQQARNAIEDLVELEIDLEGDEGYTETARKAYKVAYGE